MKSIKEKFNPHLDDHVIKKNIPDEVKNIVQIHVQIPIINKVHNLFSQLAVKMGMKDIL